MKKILSKIKESSFYGTIEHGFNYSMAYVFVQLLSVIALPFFTKYLTTSDFGIVEITNNSYRILALIFTCNIANGTYRFMFDKEIDKEALLKFSFRVTFIGLFLGTILLYLFRSPLITALNVPDNVFWLIVVGMVWTAVFNLFTFYNNAKQFSRLQAFWHFFIYIMRIAFAILAILFISQSYLGRLLGENVIALILCVFILIYYFRKLSKVRTSVTNKREIFFFSLSFVPLSLSGFVLGYFDSIMINSMEGNADAGVYSYAYKIAVIYSGLSSSVIMANKAIVLKLMEDKQHTEVISQFRSLFKLILVAFTGFVFFAEIGGRVLALNDAFYEGLFLLPILILAHIFSNLNDVYGGYVFYFKKTKIYYWSLGISSLINIILNWIFIPIYGYPAAAFTTLVAYVVMFSITYIACKFRLPAKIPIASDYFDYAFLVLLVMAVHYGLRYLALPIGYDIVFKFAVIVIISSYLWANWIKRYLKSGRS